MTDLPFDVSKEMLDVLRDAAFTVEPTDASRAATARWNDFVASERSESNGPKLDGFDFDVKFSPENTAYEGLDLENASMRNVNLDATRFVNSNLAGVVVDTDKYQSMDFSFDEAEQNATGYSQSILAEMFHDYVMIDGGTVSGAEFKNVPDGAVKFFGADTEGMLVNGESYDAQQEEIAAAASVNSRSNDAMLLISRDDLEGICNGLSDVSKGEDVSRDGNVAPNHNGSQGICDNVLER